MIKIVDTTSLPPVDRWNADHSCQFNVVLKWLPGSSKMAGMVPAVMLSLMPKVCGRLGVKSSVKFSIDCH